MDLQYREWTKDDEPAISTMMKMLYLEDSDNKQLSDEYISKTFRQLSDHPDQGTVLSLIYNNELIGYCLLIFFWSNEFGGVIVTIDEFYIISKYRNQGLGSQFIKILINNRYNNAVAIQLEVMPNNIKAKKLYEQIGFKISNNSHYHIDLVY